MFVGPKGNKCLVLWRPLAAQFRRRGLTHQQVRQGALGARFQHYSPFFFSLNLLLQTLNALKVFIFKSCDSIHIPSPHLQGPCTDKPSPATYLQGSPPIASVLFLFSSSLSLSISLCSEGGRDGGIQERGFILFRDGKRNEMK